MKNHRKIICILVVLGIAVAVPCLIHNKTCILPLAPAKAFAGDKNKNGSDAGEQEKKDKTKKENPCPPCPECPDPAKVVLRGLEEKRNMIEKKSKELALQKKDLEAYEEQLDEKLADLKALKKQIESDLALLNKAKSRKEQEKQAAYNAKINRLVKMYAGMKPKNAARIVDKMDINVAQEIFSKMRESSASQILSYVDSAKAARISERLAFKRR
jgi:flagellar motility protein MotE (MotC chaperone)